MYRPNIDRKHRVNKKSLIIAGIIGLVLLGGALLAYKLHRDTYSLQNKDYTAPGRNPINYGPPSEQDKKDVEQNKVTDPKEPPKQTTGASTAQTPSSATIVSATQDEQQNLVITTKLTGSGWNQCSLTLTRGATTLTKKVDTLYQSDFSTCLGYSIARGELSSGTWSIQLTAYKKDGTSFVSNKATVDIH